MPTPLTIARTTENATGLFESLFGGLFVLKGVSITFQLGWALLMTLTFLSVAAAIYRKNVAARRLSQILPCIALVLLGFIFFQPWDELFVNLRHSLNLAEGAGFSFNRGQKLEATVDFLPYFVLGVLAKLGVPLVEAALIFSITGSVLCLWAGRALLIGWKIPYADVLSLPILSLFPIFWFNAGHGFSTSLFGAAILWAVVAFQRHRQLAGLVLLSVVPLIRMEGIWCTILLLGYYYRKERRPAALLAFIPFIALCLWRQANFGSVMPLPIQYKNTPGNLFFIGVGIRNFVADLTATYSFFALFVISVLWTRNKKLKFAKEAMVLLGVLLLFVLPYYLSGGDWFPNAWGRYLFPFAVFSICLGVAVSLDSFSTITSKERVALTLLFVCIYGLHSFIAFGPKERVENYLFSGRRVLADLSLNKRKKRRMNYRLQYLAQLGHHLQRTTDPKAVIATSEIAAISFHARRETLDLLGVANPEIVHAPLRETPSFIESPSEDMELPHLIFKRVNPPLVAKHMPDYLYLFDAIKDDLMEETTFQEMTDERFVTLYERWKHKFTRLIDGVYGGLEGLNTLGYRPIFVQFANGHLSLYYVSKKAYDDHLERLKAAGFKISKT